MDAISTCAVPLRGLSAGTHSPLENCRRNPGEFQRARAMQSNSYPVKSKDSERLPSRVVYNSEICPLGSAMLRVSVPPRYREHMALIFLFYCRPTRGKRGENETCRKRCTFSALQIHRHARSRLDFPTNIAFFPVIRQFSRFFPGIPRFSEFFLF